MRTATTLLRVKRTRLDRVTERPPEETRPEIRTMKNMQAEDKKRQEPDRKGSPKFLCIRIKNKEAFERFERQIGTLPETLKRPDKNGDILAWYRLPPGTEGAKPYKFAGGKIELTPHVSGPSKKVEPVPPALLRLITGRKFILEDEFLELPVPKMIADGRVPEGNVLVYAPPEHGKSLSMIGFGECVTLGLDWYGTKILDPGPVFYVAAERAAGVRKRIAAFREHRGITAPNPRFFLMGEPVNLFDAEGVDALIRELVSICPEGTPKIIYDTLNRCIGNADENSNKDMGEVMRNIDRIRNETGANLSMLVHHTPKDGKKTPRGASVLSGGVDTEIFLNKPAGSDTVTVSCHKQSDFERFPPFKLRLVQVPIVVRGEPMTSVVLVPSEELQLDAKHQHILDALRVPKTYSEWWDAVKDKMSESTFKRKKKELEDHGRVSKNKDVYTLGS